MMKSAAICCIMDFDEYLPYSLDSVKDAVDHVIFLVGSQSWGTPDIKVKPAFKEYMLELEKTNPKYKVVFGDWATETEQRNYGTEVAKSLGCEIGLIWDSDEVYGEGMAARVLNALEESQAVVVRGPMLTFFKKVPLCVINPPEPFQPYLAYKFGQFQFTDNRGGMGLQDGKLVAPLCLGMDFNNLQLFHFSFARTDEFVKNKIESFSHKVDMIPNWYENVWSKFQPGMRNIHPCWENQWQQAVPFPLNNLPPKLNGYFTMQLEKKTLVRS